MKTIAVCLMTVALAACSSPPPKSSANDTSVKTKPVVSVDRNDDAASSGDLSLQSSKGMLTIGFDVAGNWTRIATVGTAEMPEGAETSAAAQETAFMIATLRAKRALAEFLGNEVRSTRTVTRIARTLSNAQRISDGAVIGSADDFEAEGEGSSRAGAESGGTKQTQQDRHAEHLASRLTERISDQTSAILRGAHVTRRSVRESSVAVELSATRASIDSSREIARRMNGLM